MPYSDPVVAKEKRREYYAKNRAKIIARSRNYAIENRKRIAERRVAYYLAHREERMAYVRMWRIKNRARLLKKARRYYLENKDRLARMTTLRKRLIRSLGKFSKKSHYWRDLKSKYGYMCLRCKSAEPVIRLTPDHVCPISKGGLNVIENIQPLCMDCNRWKGRRVIDFRM